MIHLKKFFLSAQSKLSNEHPFEHINFYEPSKMTRETEASKITTWPNRYTVVRIDPVSCKQKGEQT